MNAAVIGKKSNDGRSKTHDFPNGKQNRGQGHVLDFDPLKCSWTIDNFFGVILL